MSALDASPISNRWTLAVHGFAVEIDNAVPGIEPAIRHVLSDFSTPCLPEGFTPTLGQIRRYEVNDVTRSVSSRAFPLPHGRDLVELYKDGERYWMIDDRWGMSEINLLRGRWTSWILANPLIDALGAMELSVLWPMAHLLRPKGLFLVPAISAVRDGFAVLIISPLSLETELHALVRAGFRIIGQRWTALREEDGRIAMLQMPGLIERQTEPRKKHDRPVVLTNKAPDPLANWVDLMGWYLGSQQTHAFCDAVVVVEPGRRLEPRMRPLNLFTAINVLRRAWPIAELNPQRRYGQLPIRLAQHCRVAELQLSRNPQDLLALLNQLRHTPRTRMVTAHVPSYSSLGRKAQLQAG